MPTCSSTPVLNRELQQVLTFTAFPSVLPRLPAPQRTLPCSHLGTGGLLCSSGSSPEGAGSRWWCCGQRGDSRCRSRSGACCRAAAPSGSEPARAPVPAGGCSTGLQGRAEEKKSITAWAAARQIPFLFSGITARFPYPEAAEETENV